MLRAWVLVVLLVVARAVAGGEPPTQPIPGVETGMHGARISRIDSDASERFLVTASDDKTARVWELGSGKLLRVLRLPQGTGNDGKAYAVAITPDASTVAVGGWTGYDWEGSSSIYLFDRESGQLRQRIRGLPEVIGHLQFSPDGRALVATLSGKNGIRIFETSGWTEIARDDAYRDVSYWAEFHHNGRLVSSSYDGQIRLYERDGRTYRKIKQVLAPRGKRPVATRFSPDGGTIAVGFDDVPVVALLSARDLSELRGPDIAGLQNGNLGSVAWSADGQWLYAAGAYDEQDWSPVLRWRSDASGVATRWPAAFHTIMGLRALSGGRLAYGSGEPSFGILDAQGARSLERIGEKLDFRDNDPSLRLSRRGDIVQFRIHERSPPGTGLQRSLMLFDLLARTLEPSAAPREDLAPPRVDGEPRENWKNTRAARVGGREVKLEALEMSRALSLAPAGGGFILGAEWGVYAFDGAGKQRWRVPAPSVPWAVNQSADGRFAVAAFADGTIRWYDLASGAERLALFVHADRKRWVLWTPEGFYQASPGADELIGYHLNQGADRAGERIDAGQLARLFYRPDLITARIEGNERVIADAVKQLGDVRAVLAGGLPPIVRIISSAGAEIDGDYALEVEVTGRSGGIGALELRINDSIVTGRDGWTPAGGGRLRQRIAVTPGTNVIGVVAYRADGKVASDAAQVAVTRRAPADIVPALRVLAVGVSEYVDATLKEGVRFAAKDAREVASRLQAAGKAVYREVDVQILDRSDQTRLAAIEREIERLKTRARPEDVVVVFLAGHGKVDDGEYHFIPSDWRDTGADAFARGTLSAAKLETMLGGLGAGKRLLILDTCHSGVLVQPTRSGASEQKDALRRLMRNTGRYILAAAAPQGKALEAGVKGHGVYSYALLEGLSGRASPAAQDRVELDDLARYLEDRVPELTRELFSYEQVPMKSAQGQSFWLPRVPR